MNRIDKILFEYFLDESMKKEIRFESGTTAITVFDKIGTQEVTAAAPFRLYVPSGFSTDHKSGYLPYLWV